MPEPHSEDGLLRAVHALFHPAQVTCDELWLRVRRERLRPEIRSGWKLHVSATPANFEPLLAAALPVLDASGLPFKLARSIETLEDLNDGRYGLTQVGKAITVYPPDETAAAALAENLREVLRDFDGPAIPTDFRPFDDAPLYCRFGPFDFRVRIDALGQKQRLLVHPESGDVVDPADGGDAAPVMPSLLPYHEPADHLAFLRTDYFFVRLLQITAKGAVFQAILRRAPDTGFLLAKTARKGTNADAFGRDALWGARNEQNMLRMLANVTGVPPCPELLRDADRTVALVRPWLDGATFWERWTAPDARTTVVKQQLAAMLRQLMAVVDEIHGRGVIVRDLAPANLLEREGGVVVLDWELAHPIETDARPYRRGTPGFYDPARDRLHAPDVRDDHYALLALAFMTGSGTHPILLPTGLCNTSALKTFFPESVLPHLENARTHLDNAAEFSRAYKGLLGAICPERESAREVSSQVDRAALRDALWRDVLDTAGALEQGIADIDDVTVYSGMAGRMITAAECGVEALCEPAVIDQFRPLLSRLMDEAAAVGHIPGMYFGLPGVALAATVLGGLWEDREIKDAGLRALTSFDPPEAAPPDVCHGLAGYTLSLLAAHRIAGAGACRETAVVAGKTLLHRAVREKDDVFWPWPAGPYGTLSGAQQFGFAHGIAGVCYALLRLYEAADGEAHRRAAEDAVDTLARSARPLENAGDAVWWPVSAEDETAWNAWCHGTPGVVKTLALATTVLGRGADRELLLRAVRGMHAANNPGFCLCHGIASRLDAALDAATASPLAAEAHRDAAILAALDLPRLENAAWRLERGGRARGLMTGAAGVWRTLLRYAGGLENPFRSLLP